MVQLNLLQILCGAIEMPPVDLITLHGPNHPLDEPGILMPWLALIASDNDW